MKKQHAKHDENAERRKKTVLFYDDFSQLRTGEIKEIADGPYREMHARPSQPDDNTGGWELKAIPWGVAAQPYACVDTPRGRRIISTVSATVNDNFPLLKGDIEWRDYVLETRITLLSPEGLKKLKDSRAGANSGKNPVKTPHRDPAMVSAGGSTGVIFRCTDTRNYFAALIDPRHGVAKLAKRVDGHWDLLDSKPIEVRYDSPVRFQVTVRRNKLRAKIGGVRLSAKDCAHPFGRIGLLGASPCVFEPVSVKAGIRELRRLEKVKGKQGRRLAKLRRKAPRAVAWKKFDVEGFGSGRRIRLGDLTGDGQPDILFSRYAPRSKRKGGVDFLAAMNLEGELLWTVGEKQPAADLGEEFSASAPMQINDIDGDGRNEVVVVMDGVIRVLDGSSGREKYSAPVPAPKPVAEEYKGSMNHFGGGFGDKGDRLPISHIAFADLIGRGARRDLLLVDSYHQALAMSPDLKKTYWHLICSHGHFPVPMDFDGDGKDSVILGYRHVAADGSTIGRVCLQDHQDAIFAGPLDDEGRGPYEILMAAGEDGLLRLTPEFNIHWRDMGHVQRLSIGKFRPELSGLCVATVLFHGNRGITTLFDSGLMRLEQWEFPVIGSTLQPVLFDDSGAEYMFLSGIRPSQGYAGGLINGYGELVVPMPDDGGPGYCCWACDIDGDGLDELITWDYNKLWIYHSSCEPDPARLMRRVRPPLYNTSNFQAYYSLPEGVRV